jgi:hypothetical protein
LHSVRAGETAKEGDFHVRDDGCGPNNESLNTY